MKKILWAVLVSLLGAAVLAQGPGGGDAVFGNINGSGILAMTGLGTHTFTANSAGVNTVKVTNSSAGTSTAARFLLQNNNGYNAGYTLFAGNYTPTANWDQPNYAGLWADTSATGLALAAMNTSAGIHFYNGTTRTGFSKNGWRFGATATDPGTGNIYAEGTVNSQSDLLLASNIADSVAVPTINGGCGTGSPSIGTNAKDYAFFITLGTSPTTCVIDFNRTYTHAPICITINNSTAIVLSAAASTTQLTITGTFSVGNVITVLCRGN